MKSRFIPSLVLGISIAALTAERPKPRQARFQTSDRCLACHNGLQTQAGEDISIGFDWRSTMMANSSRDPYWQAGVRREVLEHPEASAEIQDECSVCHMPIARHDANLQGKLGEVFSHLPFGDDEKQGRRAQDGVSCSVCHQIADRKLGTRESFNGRFVVDPPDDDGNRREYGPFDVDKGRTRIMRTSSEGYRPAKSDHIRKSELCATCHTLYTKALGPGGKVIGELPEQMPFQEWLHSDFKDKQSCQSCHMPVIKEPVAITSVLGELREDVARHVFVGGNFFMLRMLNRYRDDLEVTALPSEMSRAIDRATRFLQTQTARVSLENCEVADGRLQADVVVVNLSGHKFPTAYPSRRAWLHVTVRDADRKILYESGALRRDGLIEGNDNDSDGARFEPHYDEIRGADHVQIYESIMSDRDGQVTTGLLSAVRYAKDNRLLPRGFEKGSASKDVAVIGGAVDDANFGAGGDRVRYRVTLGHGAAPFTIEAELLFQPIGFRWANNLKQFKAAEARRFNSYFDAMGTATAMRIAGATWVQRRAANPF